MSLGGFENGGKREIEAVCDVFEGGLMGYLTWKIKTALHLNDDQEDNAIALQELDTISDDLQIDDNDIDDMNGIWC